MAVTEQRGITLLHPGEGEALWVLGDQVTFKADGGRDGMTLFVSTIPPGGGPPPHVHHQQEEAHYVISGTFSFLNGDEWIEAPAGSFLWIPRGVVHTFRNAGSETGQLFSTNNLPGSHERWFRHVGVPIADPATFQPTTEKPDLADVLASAAREDIHIMRPAHP